MSRFVVRWHEYLNREACKYLLNVGRWSTYTNAKAAANKEDEESRHNCVEGPRDSPTRILGFTSNHYR